MASYRIYVPKNARQAGSRDDGPTLVADGFCWSASLLGPLWCIWQKTLIGLAAWLATAVAMTAIIYVTKMSATSSFLIVVLALLAFGFEANVLRARSLERRNMSLADIVIADDVEQAEMKFFQRDRSAQNAQTSMWPIRSTAENRTVGIGLFPDHGG